MFTVNRSRFIAAPFHDGVRNVDRGRGPEALLAAAHVATFEAVGPIDASAPEAARVFEVARRLAGRVRAARADGMFPLVLAGDCNSCIGTVAGCGTDDLSVIWFDAHPDFDTPDASRSGSLDAMGLALLTGEAGWTALRETVGLSPIAEGDVVLVGVRDFEPGQRERLRASRIRWLEGDRFTDGDLETALDEQRLRTPRAYLHIDLDVLDTREGLANQYGSDGGLSLVRLLAAVDGVFRRFDVAAAAVTAYNPEVDTDGRMAGAGAQLVHALASRAPRVGSG